jgi:hypothetical protein
VTRATATLAALIALVLALPTAASADVDPASDVLLFQNEFFPRVNPPAAAMKDRLTALTKQANDKGYAIKVAIIGARLDLGGAPQLYRHPDQYAKFLGIELRSATGLVQPLLVVMKGGVGTYGMGDEAKAVKDVKVPDQPSGDQLTEIAIEATKRVSAVAGHPLSAAAPQPAAKTGGGSSGGAPIVAFAAPVGLLLVLGLVFWVRRKAGSGEPAP